MHSGEGEGNGNGHNGDKDDSDTTKEGAQDKALTKGEIKRLKDAGEDIHKLKQEVMGSKNVSQFDLFKTKNGDIVVKPKNGKGPSEPTGLNINDFFEN